MSSVYSLDVLVSNLVRQLRTVEFARPGRYEALLARRDGLLDVFLFNHDRLRQPCGLGDEGEIYRGPVRLHLASVGQASAGLRVVRLDDDMHLHDAKFRCVDGWLEIDAEIDRSSEYVVGPAADFEHRLFS